MSNGRIRVSGYAQRQFFGNGIEYRNYSEALVGQTSATGNEASIFTLNNFSITTNIDSKPDKNFITNKFSSFTSLDTLNLNINTLQALLDNNAKIFLNFDPTEISNYAYFGSMVEFVRVSLENIIMNWPASLFIDIIDNITTINTGNTVYNYDYNSLTDVATFKIDTNHIFNPYGVNYLINGDIISSFATNNDLKILSSNYLNYVISVATGEFDIIGFTGATNVLNDFITIQTKGNVFSASTPSIATSFHLKPNKINVETFFNSLDTFQDNLLNRLSIPNYRSTFSYQVETDGGNTILSQQSLIWPVSDGYNLDFNTTKYTNYVSDLLTMAQQADESQSNLLARFLTSQSISDFDTIPNDGGTQVVTEGQIMNKTLKIYGRSFDYIKQYIDGLAYANVVTYDKKNNTPDATLKNLSSLLGWQLLSPSEENDIINHYLNTNSSTYSGQSRGLTAAESEVELWRRLIMNTPWLWKSKGTRKGVEFLFKFIGTPDGLVTFNEYVYTAKKPLNIELFTDVVEKITGSRDISAITIDSDGYPMTLPDTPEMYFQKGGLWYRETGGPNSHLDILVGNNPHIGPYDAGSEYINQFNVLIPNFSSTTITEEVITTGETNIFLNYNSGIINGTPLSGTVYADLQSINRSLSDGYNVLSGGTLVSSIIADPFPITDLTCGCDTSAPDEALKFTVGYFSADTNSLLQIILGGNHNNGVLYSVNSNETCGLEINFDYLINYDCTNIIDGVNEILSCLNSKLASDVSDRNTLLINIGTYESQIAALTGVTQTTLVIAQIAALNVLLGTANNSLAIVNNTINSDSILIAEFTNQPILTFLSNFKVTFSLLKSLPVSGTPPYLPYQAVYSETILDIINTEDYITNNTNTGLYMTGNNCGDLYNSVNSELSGNCSVLSANTFNSSWLNYNKVITDSTIIAHINNGYIKIGISVDWSLPTTSNCNTHKKYSILLDNIKLNKICTSHDRTDVTLTKSPSFELTRTIDNRKSWINTNSKITREYNLTGRETFYDLNDSRLLINSKEVDINIDGAHAIETNTAAYINHLTNTGIRFLDNAYYTGYTGFVFAEPHGLSVGDSIEVMQDAGYLNASYNGLTTIIDIPDSVTIVTNKFWGVNTPANPGTVYPFFIPELTTDVSNLNSTDDFIKIITTELIDAKDRKVLGAYPTLRQLYDKYLGLVSLNCATCSQSSQYDYMDLQTFSNLIGTYWVDLIEQVIPSTTIWGSTYVYRNTIFDSQVFKYKKGTSFFGTLPSGLPPTIATNSTIQVIMGEVPITSNFDNCTIIPSNTQNVSGVTIVQLDNSSEFIGTVTII